MKKKIYEQPAILVVQLTQCAMLANSIDTEGDLVRERRGYRGSSDDFDEEW